MGRSPRYDFHYSSFSHCRTPSRQQPAPGCHAARRAGCARPSTGAAGHEAVPTAANNCVQHRSATGTTSCKRTKRAPGLGNSRVFLLLGLVRNEKRAVYRSGWQFAVWTLKGRHKAGLLFPALARLLCSSVLLLSNIVAFWHRCWSKVAAPPGSGISGELGLLKWAGPPATISIIVLFHTAGPPFPPAACAWLPCRAAGRLRSPLHRRGRPRSCTHSRK